MELETLVSKEDLAPRAAAMLRALREAGSWLSRQELADATGKTKLSPNDVNHLENMARQGLIEVRETPVSGPAGFRFEYRSKGGRE